MSTQASINVSFNGTSSFSPGYIGQQTTILDSTNPAYLRQVNLRQNCVVISKNSVGIQVFIPLTQLFAAAGAAVPGITWPPVINQQPTSSTITHPAPLYFYVSASDEINTDLKYQWYWESSSLSTFVPCPTTYFAGTASAALTCSVTSVNIENSASYYCIVFNPTGGTTSSLVNSYIL